MEVTDVHERWAEEDERERAWVQVDKVLEHLTRKDLLTLWKNLLTCCVLETPKKKEDKPSSPDEEGRWIHHMFWTLKGLFERRKVPMAMRPRTRIPFLMS